ncbi:hypothetical protein VRC24_23955 [Pseudomonas poae]|uniref:hypothetical protein n=1 Tax=Pseudomonas poae TaxID=200451 RepID=UPI0030D5580D
MSAAEDEIIVKTDAPLAAGMVGGAQAQETAAPDEVAAPEESINDDDREKKDWKSRYEVEALKEIKADAIYVGIVLLVTLLAFVFIWRGTAFNIIAYECDACKPEKFNQYSLFFFGGMLGGTLFGIKYLYKVVARGYWNIDRRLWRVFTPFVSGGSALAIGGLLDSGMLGLSIKSSTSSFYFSLGFISGYFADGALAKMQEIADTVFGSIHRRKDKK